MLARLFKALKRFLSQRSRESDLERFLSESKDVHDLEYRERLWNNRRTQTMWYI